MHDNWRHTVKRFLLALSLLGTALPANAALSDLQGRPIPRKDYRRIVSLAPSNTELMYAIGWEDRLVGVSDFCNYPPRAMEKPKVGGPETLNIERMISLKPDLILTVGFRNAGLLQVSKLTGAPIAVLDNKTVAGIAKNAEALSECLGPDGRIFAHKFRQQLAMIKPHPGKLKMFYLVWDRPLMTAGEGTYLDDLIKLAGGVNVAKVKDYAAYSDEALLMAKPDVLIYSLNQQSAAKALQARLNVPIIGVEADEISRPGPRIPKVLSKLLAELNRKFPAHKRP